MKYGRDDGGKDVKSGRSSALPRQNLPGELIG
jgi:hypothetical protein